MRRNRPFRLTFGLALLVPLAAIAAVPAGATGAAANATAAPARSAHHPKRHVVRRWHGYGFLPGYRSPEQIEWEDAVAAWRRGPAYWYGFPRFYHNRWNSGGFGPCWTQTPIGNVWNCGR